MVPCLQNSYPIQLQFLITRQLSLGILRYLLLDAKSILKNAMWCVLFSRCSRRYFDVTNTFCKAIVGVKDTIFTKEIELHFVLRFKWNPQKCIKYSNQSHIRLPEIITRPEFPQPAWALSTSVVYLVHLTNSCNNFLLGDDLVQNGHSSVAYAAKKLSVSDISDLSTTTLLQINRLTLSVFATQCILNKSYLQ